MRLLIIILFFPAFCLAQDRNSFIEQGLWVFEGLFYKKSTTVKPAHQEKAQRIRKMFQEHEDLMVEVFGYAEDYENPQLNALLGYERARKLLGLKGERIIYKGSQGKEKLEFCLLRYEKDTATWFYSEWDKDCSRDIVKPEQAKPIYVKRLVRGEMYKNQKISLGRLFGIDSAALRAESFKALDELIVFMNQNRDVVFRVESHSHYVPDHAYCDSLTNARANTVRSYLLEKGLNPKRVFAKGYGKRKPISTERPSERNIRTEIRILHIGLAESVCEEESADEDPFLLEDILNHHYQGWTKCVPEGYEEDYISKRPLHMHHVRELERCDFEETNRLAFSEENKRIDFPDSSGHISGRQFIALYEIYLFMQANKDFRFEIRCHVKESQVIAQQRADEIRDFLGICGINLERLKASGIDRKGPALELSVLDRVY